MSALICMAVHNGERWLPAQIESIQRQSDPDWKLWISDDGSVDGSPAVLKHFAAGDERIRLLPDRRKQRPGNAKSGAAANFEYLLGAALNSGPDLDWQFVALCDQDDIWDPDKVSLQRASLTTHAACCSDLLLVNAAGAEAGGRMLRQLRSPPHPDLSSILAQNSVVGCTLALRREVLELALPFPEGLINHDWWLALCALTLGSLYCDSRALVQYRQHADNVVGAFRPMRQLTQLGSLLERQRRVLESQRIAVDHLLVKLTQCGMQPPQVLHEYLIATQKTDPIARAREQLGGEFAARSMPLRALRALAALGAASKA